MQNIHKASSDIIDQASIGAHDNNVYELLYSLLLQLCNVMVFNLRFFFDGGS